MHTTTGHRSSADQISPGLSEAAPRAPGVSPQLIVAALALAIVTAHAAVLVDRAEIAGYVTAALVHGAIYLVAVWLVVRGQCRKRDLLFILLTGIVLRGMAMTAEPNLTTDAYRYVWDGRIQAAGINPYLMVPADERLAPLRDDVIYPNINQKETARTIYPPMAEIVFLAATYLAGGIAGMKLIMVVFEALTVWALVAWLRADRLPPERVLIYAWHPLPIWELASQAHVDAAAIGLLMLAIVLARRGWQGASGATLACAALVKYYPAMLLPALWRRWDWRMPAAFLATATLLYLPYVAGAGPKVLGFLFDHLDHEGYASGYGFHLIWFLRDYAIADPPGEVYVAAALGVLGVLTLVALLRRGLDEIRPEYLLLLATAFTFLTSPHYPWYFVWLTALLARVVNPGVLALTLLCVVLQVPRPPGGPTWTALLTWAYVVPLTIAVAYEAWRWRRRPGA